MGFINELIPKEDFQKYNFEELNKKKPARGASTQWTIDRDADIWIRVHDVESDHTMPGGGYTGVRSWNYYWKGTLMYVVLKKVDAYSDENNHRYRIEKIVDFKIPQELESHKFEIIKDLERGLTAYNGGGIMSRNFDVNEYHYTLEVSGEL